MRACANDPSSNSTSNSASNSTSHSASHSTSNSTSNSASNSTPARAGLLRLRSRSGFEGRAGTRVLRIPTVLILFVLCIPVWGCGQRLGRQRDWLLDHPDAPAAIKRAVVGKSLVRGMSFDAVVASWGEPDEKRALLGRDARWTYVRAQIVSGRRITIRYILIFNRGYVARIEQLRGP